MWLILPRNPPTKAIIPIPMSPADCSVSQGGRFSCPQWEAHFPISYFCQTMQATSLVLEMVSLVVVGAHLPAPAQRMLCDRDCLLHRDEPPGEDGRKAAQACCRWRSERRACPGRFLSDLADRVDLPLWPGTAPLENSSPLLPEDVTQLAPSHRRAYRAP
jgi:hypothetical protein